MKTSRCRNCGEVFKNKHQKILHKKKYPNGCKNIEKEVDNKMGMFGKNKKGKPTSPPVDDDFEDVEVDDEEEDELEDIEAETKAIKKEIETTKAKRKPPVETPVEAPVEPVEEELTEDKVKQILINFEQRLQKIEYNLRLIPY